MTIIKAKIISANTNEVNLIPHLNKTVIILSNPGSWLDIETIDHQLRTIVPSRCLGGIGDSSEIFLSQCR